MTSKEKKRVNKQEDQQLKAQKKQSFVQGLLTNFWKKYSKDTQSKIKIIDLFLLYLITLIVWQVFYRITAGTDFPKNAFLSGFFAPLGIIVMTVALRMQIGSEEQRPNKIPYYRAFWEYVFGVVVFFVVIVNFLG